MSPLSRNGSPSWEKRTWKLYRIGAGQTIQFRIETGGWIDLHVHWTTEGSRACTRTKDCRWCQRGHSRCWRAYVVGYRKASGLQRIIELTYSAAYDIEESPLYTNGLCGLNVELSRPGIAKNGRCFCRVLNWEYVDVPASMDHLQRCVELLYSVAPESLGVLPA